MSFRWIDPHDVCALKIVWTWLCMIYRYVYESVHGCDNRISIMVVITWSTCMWLSNDTLSMNWTACYIWTWEYMNMMMCNTLASIWMNETIRTFKKNSIIEQTHDKYSLWFFGMFINVNMYVDVNCMWRRMMNWRSFWQSYWRRFICWYPFVAEGECSNGSFYPFVAEGDCSNGIFYFSFVAEGACSNENQLN